MSKIRRIEITIETHEITRIHKGRIRSSDDGIESESGHYVEDWQVAVNTPGPDLVLFSENCPEPEVSNPTPLAVDDHSHIPGKALNG